MALTRQIDFSRTIDIVLAGQTLKGTATDIGPRGITIEPEGKKKQLILVAWGSIQFIRQDDPNTERGGG